MGKFDGYFDPPDYERPCDVCGTEDCLCPACPTCGDHGNPKCYRDHGMVLTPEQEASRLRALKASATDVEPDFHDPHEEYDHDAD